jgi:hypothetical protein
MKTLLSLVLLSSSALLLSCSNGPKRKVAGPGILPSPAVATDGRIMPRNSEENRKRLEHYNSLQHK